MTNSKDNSKDKLQGDKNTRVLESNLESLIFEVETIKNNISRYTDRLEQLEGTIKLLTTGEVKTVALEPIELKCNKSGRPSKYECIIKEYYLKGYSYSRIEEITGASYSTVAKTIRRLREKGVIK